MTLNTLPIIKEFQDVFPEEIPILPPHTDIDLVPQEAPVFRASYWMSLLKLLELGMELQELLDKDYITPSMSPLVAPMFFGKKEDDIFRKCIHYHQLNTLTNKKKFPFPRIDYLFSQVQEETMFSKIDLRIGFHEMRINPEDVHKRTFRTRYQHYKFVVFPFNLSNTLTMFMSWMNIILSKFVDRFVLVFIYDILIYLKNEEPKEHPKLVLQKLRENHLYAKYNKCKFYKTKIQYIGHIISEGLVVDPEKVKAMVKWLVQRDILIGWYFMGLAWYYQWFIEGFSKIAHPITSLQWKEFKYEQAT